MINNIEINRQYSFQKLTKNEIKKFNDQNDDDCSVKKEDAVYKNIKMDDKGGIVNRTVIGSSELMS